MEHKCLRKSCNHDYVTPFISLYKFTKENIEEFFTAGSKLVIFVTISEKNLDFFRLGIYVFCYYW